MRSSGPSLSEESGCSKPLLDTSLPEIGCILQGHPEDY